MQVARNIIKKVNVRYKLVLEDSSSDKMVGENIFEKRL